MEDVLYYVRVEGSPYILHSVELRTVSWKEDKPHMAIYGQELLYLLRLVYRVVVQYQVYGDIGILLPDDTQERNELLASLSFIRFLTVTL